VAFDGKVRVSKYYRGYGNLIIVRHANGLETFYAHLSARDVDVNDWVTAGQVIGKGGSTGRSSGPHLHFETRYRGYAFDPEWLIKFPEGNLRNATFTLKRKYLSPASHYVPTSDDEEEEILLAEQEERAAEAKKAAAQAAVQYYTIRKGDTLGSIAGRYHTTVSKLCKLNNITPKTTLHIGRRIRVR
ncbi:MAG: peptidoglycan DD-metalloendopeptidase family protein, partial [Bacteroidales bacterium]|nr:peptidoglycan DD-metalloendopeptidase family protein [Bacteroidales bacterium]